MLAEDDSDTMSITAITGRLRWLHPTPPIVAQPRLQQQWRTTYYSTTGRPVRDKLEWRDVPAEYDTAAFTGAA